MTNLTNLSVQTLYSTIGESIEPIRIRVYQPYLRKPGMVSFAGGWPDPTLFPLETVEAITKKVVLEEGATALQYNPTQGHERLRDEVSKRMEAQFGIDCTAEQVCITSGAQQGIFLSAMLFVNRGDTVAIEAPTFSGGISVYKNFGASFLEIPMDDEGLQTDVMAKMLAEGQSIKLLYTIPDFQNPSGYSMSLERRKALLALAEQYNFIIVEDSPYSELRYEGEQLPPLYQLDQNNRVIYLGSFSKIFAPVRLGWMIASPELIQKAVLGKQSIDLCCPALTQSIAYHFMHNGELDHHIQVLKESYGYKRQVMLAGLDKFMPAEVNWSNPTGGMFIWVSLPEGTDTEKVFYEAIAQNIGFVPGSAFFQEFKPRSTMRLNFISASAEQISAGMQTLGSLLNQFVS